MPHGLGIDVTKKEIRVFVNKDGEHIFYLCFDENGEETKRVDKQNQFTDIKSQIFLRL